MKDPLDMLGNTHGGWDRASHLAPSSLDAVRLVVASAEGQIPPMLGEGPVTADDIRACLELVVSATQEWEQWVVRLVEVARMYHLTWEQIAQAQGLASKASACDAHRRRRRRLPQADGSGGLVTAPAGDGSAGSSRGRSR